MAQHIELSLNRDGRCSLPKTGPAPLKLLVIGATRGTGLQVARQALAAGHTVTALVRDPARLYLRHEQLNVRRGDVLNQDSLWPAMAGQDAVISTIGVTTGRAATTLYSAGMRTIVQGMEAAGVRRLIAVSASPLSTDAGDDLLFRVLLKPLLRTIFKRPYADMAVMEEEIRSSGLDWTIVRPPALTDKPATGHYRTAVNQSVRGGFSIARGDLAAGILALIADPGTARATIGIAY